MIDVEDALTAISWMQEAIFAQGSHIKCTFLDHYKINKNMKVFYLLAFKIDSNNGFECLCVWLFDPTTLRVFDKLYFADEDDLDLVDLEGAFITKQYLSSSDVIEYN